MGSKRFKQVAVLRFHSPRPSSTFISDPFVTPAALRLRVWGAFYLCIIGAAEWDQIEGLE